MSGAKPSYFMECTLELYITHVCNLRYQTSHQVNLHCMGVVMACIIPSHPCQRISSPSQVGINVLIHPLSHPCL